MKVLCYLLFAFLYFALLPPLSAYSTSVQPGFPSSFRSTEYVKWASIARKEAHSRHPRADFIDFLYVGCKASSPTVTNHIYKFWMSEDHRQFGVYITVAARNADGQVVGLSSENTFSASPSYEKWRTYAIRAVQARYPGAQIVDLRPAGCKRLSPNQASLAFTFWLNDAGPSFIKVTFSYRADTEEIISVHFEK